MDTTCIKPGLTPEHVSKLNLDGYDLAGWAMMVKKTGSL